MQKRTSRVTFNPKKFKTASETDTSRGRRIISKGPDDYHIDLTDVESDVRTLRRHHEYKIKSLSGEIRACYERVKSAVALSNDSDWYPSFIDIVTRYFNDVEPIPGTISGYMAGCLGNDGHYSCTPMCAGAIPGKRGDPCHYPVLGAEYDRDNKYFTFTYFSKGSGSDAYVFVDYDSLSSFPGFSHRDRDNLSSKKIRRVWIYGKRHSGGNYNELTDSFVPLGKIKSSVSYGPGYHGGNSGLDGGTIAIILLFLVFLIALIAVAVGSKRRGDKK